MLVGVGSTGSVLRGSGVGVGLSLSAASPHSGISADFVLGLLLRTDWLPLKQPVLPLFPARIHSAGVRSVARSMGNMRHN